MYTHPCNQAQPLKLLHVSALIALPDMHSLGTMQYAAQSLYARRLGLFLGVSAVGLVCDQHDETMQKGHSSAETITAGDRCGCSVVL